jgi:hypothetical protein
MKGYAERWIGPIMLFSNNNPPVFKGLVKQSGDQAIADAGVSI